MRKLFWRIVGFWKRVWARTVTRRFPGRVVAVQVIENALMHKYTVTVQGQARVGAWHTAWLERVDQGTPPDGVYRFKLLAEGAGVSGPRAVSAEFDLSYLPNQDASDPHRLGGPLKKVVVTSAWGGRVEAYPQFDTLAGLLEYLVCFPDMAPQFRAKVSRFLAEQHGSKMSAMYHFVAKGISGVTCSDGRVTFEEEVPLEFVVPGGVEEQVVLEMGSSITRVGDRATGMSMDIDTRLPSSSPPCAECLGTALGGLGSAPDGLGTTLIIHTIQAKPAETTVLKSFSAASEEVDANGRILIGPQMSVAVWDHRLFPDGYRPGVPVSQGYLSGFLARSASKVDEWDLSLLLTKPLGLPGIEED